MSKLKEIELEYVYVTIPAEYICVYHRILAMMADYGEDMLKDCKATCTERNSGVIECFNMFNSAVAAKKLGKNKLADLLIKYIKSKINQIYKGKDNSTSFVFPVDETGQLKAFVSCGERPKFEINPDDGELLEHKLNNGFDEHFQLGSIDEPSDEPIDESKLTIDFTPRWDIHNDIIRACCDLIIKYNGVRINRNHVTVDYYFDYSQVDEFDDVVNPLTGEHLFEIVVIYKGVTKIIDKYLTL